LGGFRGLLKVVIIFIDILGEKDNGLLKVVIIRDILGDKR